jgi:hypothetical protein
LTAFVAAAPPQLAKAAEIVTEALPDGLSAINHPNTLHLPMINNEISQLPMKKRPMQAARKTIATLDDKYPIWAKTPMERFLLDTGEPGLDLSLPNVVIKIKAKAAVYERRNNGNERIPVLNMDPVGLAVNANRESAKVAARQGSQANSAQVHALTNDAKRN